MTEEALYRPAEVAKLFGVDPKTVNRWSKEGKISFIRTPGGHRRYRASHVDQLIKSMEETKVESGS